MAQESTVTDRDLEDTTVPSRPESDPSHEARVHDLLVERMFGVRGPATRVGRFTLLEQVGAGAMGAVYAAYDPELDRKVALKLLRSSTDESGRSRMLAEARAMAQLNHRNVATVHEVGLDDGQVFIAMEFVQGQTLRQWSEQQRHWRDLLAAYRDAAKGLAAAHEAGIVHRDFKPDNVMRAEDGTVRVMDFGLARAAQAGSESPADTLRETTVVTTQTGSIVGTPAYMAPELLTGADASAASDQFAFCVSLWEALFGARPFPGTTLSELVESLETRNLVEPARSGVPMWLRRALERGLAFDPADRWPSMTALAAALSRDTTRRGPLWISGGLVVLLTGGGAAAYWHAQSQLCTGASQELADVWDEGRRAQVEAAVLGTGVSFAPTVWEHAASSLDEWAERWAQMHVRTCEATRRGEQSQVVLDLRMACLFRARMHLAAASRELLHATPDVVENAHAIVAGLPDLQRCADIEALQADVPPPTAHEAERVDAIRADLAEAKARREAGRYAQALESVVRARSRLDELEYRPIVADVWFELGAVHDELGDYAEAEVALRRALRRSVRWQQWDTARDTTLKLMYVLGERTERHDEALALRDVADGLCSEPIHAATLHNHLGLILHSKGDYAEAEAELREAIELHEQARGADDARVATFVVNLGNTLYAQARYDEAVTELRAALSLMEAALGKDHPDVGSLRSNLGLVLQAQGKYTEAEAEQREALALFDAALGSDHSNVALARSNLGMALYLQKRYAEAEAEFRAAIALGTRTLGADHPMVSRAQSNLGGALFAQGKHAQAEVELRAALAAKERTLGPEHDHVANTRVGIGGVLEAQGKLEEAEAEYRAVLELRQKKLGPDHPDVATALSIIGRMLHEQGKNDEAVPLLERALTIYEGSGTRPYLRAEAAFVLARALWPTSSARRRALELARTAADLHRQAPEPDAEAIEAVEDWLREHG